MCTLLTLSRERWDESPTLWAQRVMDDVRTNSDGVSVLLARDDGMYSNLRTMDVDVAIAVLAVTDWERCWVHTRFGTGGAAVLEHTHGFCAGGVWYMHNGCLRQAPAPSLPVDSMAIGKWLQDGTVYDKLANEHFANVFLVAPHSGRWTVVRQRSGSLYTDGLGNYATVATGDVSQPVPTESKFSYECPKHTLRSRYGWSSSAPTASDLGRDPYEWRRRFNGD